MLGSLDIPKDPRVLVGFQTWDDAGVFQLAPDMALVQTVDFFTPMVDDGHAFGAIAAANALSDVYAMGGEPLTALNILAYPSRTMPAEVLADILRGGLDKLQEAGVALLGGHSVEDAVPKYGMAITGRVHPRRILSNAATVHTVGDTTQMNKPWHNPAIFWSGF